MADQVNPLGSLATGAAQALQAVAASTSTKPASSTTKATDSKLKSGSQQGASLSKENLAEAAKSVSDYLQKSATDLKYMVDKDTGMYYFKVVDQTTQETIRQIPPEEVLEMAKRIQSWSDTSKEAAGVLLDQQG